MSATDSKKLRVASLYAEVADLLLHTDHPLPQLAEWARHRDLPPTVLAQLGRLVAQQLQQQKNYPYQRLPYYYLRWATGYAPIPQRARYEEWLHTQLSTGFFPIMGQPWDRLRHSWLDLSQAGQRIQSGSDLRTADTFTTEVARLMHEQAADYGLGGYAEHRAFYVTPAYEQAGRWRAMHLGLDIWTAAGHPVYAPVAGRVHSLRHNNAPRDYGPTLVLLHQVAPDLRFYTLYGHLDPQVLAQLRVGTYVNAGQQLALVGRQEDNGHWPPHLHFQVMLDMLGQRGDFPGVAFPDEAALWLALCPDPAPLAGLA